MKSQRLSALDKRILSALLSSRGLVSSAELSKQLDIPISTIQRRRRRLESRLVDRSYTLKTESLGMRTAELFISTKNGGTSQVADELLQLDVMVDFVNRVIGDGSVSIIAEIKFRNNADLLRIIEKIRSFSGVDNVRWVERVAFLGQNSDIWQAIIKDN